MSISLRYALSEVRENYASISWWKNRVFVPYIIGTASRYHPHYPGYENAVHVMDEDWDTLVVLDACRADAFQEFVDLDRFDHYATRVSLGSHSSEWTRRNFHGQEFADTVYVSANPHTSLIAGGNFHRIIELWDTDFDEDAGGVRPDSVLDAALDAHEQFNDKRIIVHFMQPHGPFMGSDIEDHNANERNYWQAYEDNLEYVLPAVYELLDSIPGKIAVTADHGQIFTTGLKNHLGIEGHKPRLRTPGLVHVPWAVVEGTRRDVRSGEVSEADGEHVEARLEQLGYL